MELSHTVGPPFLVRFIFIFISYTMYVLFRRFPIVLLPQVQKEIQLKREEVGLLVSAQALCFTLSKLVFGIASDRSSPLRIISVGLAIVAISSVIFGLSSSFRHIFLSVVLTGCLQGASWVPATKLVARWYDDRSYGKMFSILGCGSAIAGFLIPLVGIFYWRSFLMCMGLSGLTFSVVQIFVLRRDDLQFVQVKNDGTMREMMNIVFSPVIWTVSAMYLFSMEVRAICETWIPLYILENGLSHTQFQIAYEIGGVLGNLCSGMLLDHLSLYISVDSARRMTGVGSNILLLLVAAFSIMAMRYILIIGWLLGFFVNASINIWCMVASQMGESKISGSISAFVSFLANFGSVLAGSPLAYLIDLIGYECFLPLFLTHIAILVGIASTNIEYRIKRANYD